MLVNTVEVKENVALIKISPKCPRGIRIKKDFYLKVDKEAYLSLEAMPQEVVLYQILNYKPNGEFNVGALAWFKGTKNVPFNFTKLLLVQGNGSWESSKYAKKMWVHHRNEDRLDFTRANLDIRNVKVK
jgi:hypothetical protein